MIITAGPDEKAEAMNLGARMLAFRVGRDELHALAHRVGLVPGHRVKICHPCSQRCASRQLSPVVVMLRAGGVEG
jgi:hypothetical protein